MSRFNEKRTTVRSITFLTICLFVFSSFFPITQISSTTRADTNLEDIHVGLYNGEPVQGPSALALKNMFEWMGSTVILLERESFQNGTLDALDLVVFGGGSPDNFALDIGDVGIELIRQFVANGGSYFGICGGGMFASDILGICTGSWNTDIPGMPGGAALTELIVNRASIGPDLSNEAESYQVYFSHSAYFAPLNPASIIRIMSYPTNDEVAMFVARYGSGTLFASGPHCEFEEGSNRDGLSAYDYLNDPDSEWEILQTVTQWLINESSDPGNSNPLTTFGGIFIVLILSIVIVVSGVVLFYSRRRRMP